MDLVRVGLAIRALRRRRGWRQMDLGAEAGISQELVSLIERGHGDRVSVRVLIDVAAALDARLVVQLRWRAGDLDRLLDVDHARLSAVTVERLRRHGWKTGVEVTYDTPRSSGSIDILAWHQVTRALLVIEIKTEIASAEATFRKLDEKTRLAARIALERSGWTASAVSRLLVVEDTSTNRRRMQGATALFDSALPVQGRLIREWLARPRGAVAGRLFFPLSNRGGDSQHRGGRHRLRRVLPEVHRAHSNVDSDAYESGDDGAPPRRTILVG